MTEHVYVNANKTAVVDRFAGTQKKWKLPVSEAIRLGLLSDDHKAQERRVAPASAEKVAAPKRQTRRKTKR